VDAGAVRRQRGATTRTRAAAWVCGLACGLALVLLAGAMALVAGSDGPPPAGLPSPTGQLLNLVGLLGPPVLGGVLAARRPANPYGWLWCAYALGWAVIGFSEAYLTYAASGAPGAVAWARPVVWVGGFVFAPLLALTALILLLFPDGRPPSPRWRPLIWAIAAVCLPATVAGALFEHPPPAPPNPLAVGGTAAPLVEAVANAGVVLLFLAVLAAAGSLLARFRRSRGQQRQQLKWLAYGGAFLAAIIVADLVSLDPPGLWDIALETLSFAALYLGVGVAVLRYRLYEIDRLINRTLVYGLVTALLAGVYAAGVFALGNLLNPAGGGSELAVAASTLAVAALFQPARRRVQAMVDRRFNRARYDAARTVEAFSARLRDQVDLDSLATELVSVADQTMQPTSVSLWLRPTPARRA
jgi:hypothetical protein